jgi:predicted  nucleic acid-binding Zn-ribbon protein
VLFRSKKGYKNAPANESVVAPKAQEVAGIDNMAKKMRESVAEMVAKDSASVDDLKSAKIKAGYLQEQGADMSKELAAIDDKISRIEGPEAMKAALSDLEGAISSGDPDKIVAAADAYDKFSKIAGYESKKGIEARNKAKSIKAGRAGEKAKSAVGKTIKRGNVLAANDEKAKLLAVKDPKTGKEYTFKYQFVMRDGKSVPQVFYGGKWNDVK